MTKYLLDNTLFKVRVAFYFMISLFVITLVWDYQNRGAVTASFVVSNDTNKIFSGYGVGDNDYKKVDLYEMARSNMTESQYKVWHYELDILTDREDEFFEIERIGDDYYRVMREDAEEPLDGYYAFDLLEEVEEVEQLYKYVKKHPEFRVKEYHTNPSEFLIRYRQ